MLALFLLILVLVWPILVLLLRALAQQEPTGPRGRAYAVWLAATALTTGHVVLPLLDVVGTGISCGSAVLSGLALVAVHPLLVPLAFAPLAVRPWLCAWVAQRFTTNSH